MSESIPSEWVQFTDNGDGSADFTVTVGDDDHRFSASAEADEAVVEYDETLSWRGEIRVSEPGEMVFQVLMKSDEMTDFLEAYDLDGVRRVRR